MWPSWLEGLTAELWDGTARYEMVAGDERLGAGLVLGGLLVVAGVCVGALRPTRAAGRTPPS